MGASGWEYRVPFERSVEDTLRTLQEHVLAQGDYIWPWENFDPEYLEELDDDEVLRRPASLADLAAAKATEDFWDEGTHTILDVEAATNSTRPENVPLIRPLTGAELAGLLGTEHPTAETFDREHQPGPAGPWLDLVGQGWGGRSLIIYSEPDNTPNEVYFWGVSGD